MQDSLLPPLAVSATPQPRATPPGRRLLLLRELGFVGEVNLMSASAQLTHLLLTPIAITPQMVKRCIGGVCVDESVWASLFSLSTERTYQGISSGPLRWSVTIASTRLDGSPLALTSDACNASALPHTTPGPYQPHPRRSPNRAISGLPKASSLTRGAPQQRNGTPPVTGWW